jgi:hypothetical protein
MNRKEEAKLLLKSERGAWIISQALHLAVEELEKVSPPFREESNIRDMRLLMEELYPTYVHVRMHK